jgi:hypothetical protein
MENCDTVRGFCLGIFVLPCQYYSVHALNSSYSNVARIRKTKGKVWKLSEINALFLINISVYTKQQLGTMTILIFQQEAE